MCLPTLKALGVARGARSQRDRRKACASAVNEGMAMSESTAVHHQSDHHPLHRSRTPRWTHRATSLGVFAVLALGAVYATTALVSDLSALPSTTAIFPFVMLGVALIIALGFEFVNGFHDTANAVATVIYT